MRIIITTHYRYECKQKLTIILSLAGQTPYVTKVGRERGEHVARGEKEERPYHPLPLSHSFFLPKVL